jgi:uncharacterized protein YcbX
MVGVRIAPGRRSILEPMSAPTVSSIRVYPVKSCAGIQLSTATIGRRGILHDRSFMLVDGEGRMMTQRTHPRMSLIGTSFLDEHTLGISLPGTGKTAVPLAGIASGGDLVRVAVWRDEVDAYDQGDDVAGLLSSFLGLPSRLVRIADDAWRRSPDDVADLSMTDAWPFLGLSDSSLEELNRRLPAPVDMRRFRPNLTFSGTGPFEEDHWRELRIDGITLFGGTLCSRCTVPTIDQDSAVSSTEPTATLATYRRGTHLGPHPDVPSPNAVYFGRNFSHRGEGRVGMGARVVVVA